ncbi:hypothetical protein L484_027896 [Morus notabilis]|uniref:Uncharacterized protein n=1 Tax=Morus notabilis TaxID=981085 RepID=W9S7I6_9ROSA|nr:hypothetical protein L484_027896 [Morus notabilis]
MAATMDFYSRRPLQSELMEALEPFMTSSITTLSPLLLHLLPLQLLLLPTTISLSPPLSKPKPRLVMVAQHRRGSPRISTEGEMGRGDPFAQEPDPALAGGSRHRRGSRAGLRPSRLQAPRRLREAKLPSPAAPRLLRRRRRVRRLQAAPLHRRRRAPGHLREPGRVAVAAEAGRQEEAAGEEVLIGQAGSPSAEGGDLALGSAGSSPLSDLTFPDFVESPWDCSNGGLESNYFWWSIIELELRDLAWRNYDDRDWQAWRWLFTEGKAQGDVIGSLRGGRDRGGWFLHIVKGDGSVDLACVAEIGVGEIPR